MQKPEIVYDRNQGDIFLAKNTQFGMSNKHIDIRHHFMRDMVKYKDMDIRYIRSKDNPADIMTNNCSEADYDKVENRITEGELWELVESGRKNVKNNGLLDRVMDNESTEYSSHALADAVNMENMNDWIFVTISRSGK